MCINFNNFDVCELRATYANAKMPIEIKRDANALTKPHKEEKPMRENRQESSRKKTWYKSSQRALCSGDDNGQRNWFSGNLFVYGLLAQGKEKPRSWENGDKGQLLLLFRVEDAIVLIVIVEQPKQPKPANRPKKTESKLPRVSEKQPREEAEGKLIDCNTLTPDSCTQKGVRRISPHPAASLGPSAAARPSPCPPRWTLCPCPLRSEKLSGQDMRFIWRCGFGCATCLCVVRRVACGVRAFACWEKD